MRSIVTGGAGFIGSHLIDRLVARGDEVLVLDNLSSGKAEFLSHHTSNVTHVNVDITDFDAMSPHFEGVDVVYHFAANPDIRLGTEITDTDLKQGTIATYNVVESMRIHNVPTIMFASSSVVYGENAPMPTPEDHGLVCPFRCMVQANLLENLWSAVGQEPLVCKATFSDLPTSSVIEEHTVLSLISSTN